QKQETRDGITTITDFTYDPAHNSPKSSQYTDSNGLIRRTEYVYPGDAGSGAPASMYSSTDPNFKYVPTTPVEERTLVGGVLKVKATYQFTQSGPNLIMTSMKKYPTATSDFIEEQYQYDASSNVTAIQKSSGSSKSFLWG